MLVGRAQLSEILLSRPVIVSVAALREHEDEDGNREERGPVDEAQSRTKQHNGRSPFLLSGRFTKRMYHG